MSSPAALRIDPSSEPEAIALRPGAVIAPAAVSDLGALAAIERAASVLLRGHAPDSVLNESTDPETFRGALDEGRLFVARVDGEPVGFALIEMLAEGWPHLEEIDVHPAHGRLGLGTALVRAVCAWAAGRGFPEITLTTFRALAWNERFYARLGFEEVPATELRAELAEVLADEASRGLDPRTRVAMRYRCAARSGDPSLGG